MSEKKPLVSVILPAYNTEKYLRETIDSILRQTFTNFECIIINDGSTDTSQKIIDHYAKIDSRIIPIKQQNMGLVATLNKGVELAKGTYIARVDGDDPSFSTRLEKQVEILQKDESVVLVGGGYEMINEEGHYLQTIATPTLNDDLRRAILLRNPFGHASVVFRKDAAVQAGLYSNEFGPTEDQELWIRLAKYGSFAAVPEPVYRYRVNTGGISQNNSHRQAVETKKHLHILWQDSYPDVLTRKELIKRSSLYAKTAGSYGLDMKRQLLEDNAQIGIKFVRYKQYSAGIKQLWNVASIGRKGISAIIKRIRQLNTGSLSQMNDNDLKI